MVDTIWWGDGKELLNLTDNKPIPLQTFCITKPWRINYCKYVRNGWTFLRINSVSGDVLRLTVSLRYAFVLLDEFKPKIVLPLYSQNVIHHAIDQRWLASSSSSYYHKNFLRRSSFNSFGGLSDALFRNHAVLSSHSCEHWEFVNWRGAIFNLLRGGEQNLCRFIRNKKLCGLIMRGFTILRDTTCPFTL